MNGTVSDGPSGTLPGPGQRLRCAACGNLTRFDVVSRRRTSAYWHYSLAGALSVEAEQELESTAEQLHCRWCRSDQVEVVDAPGTSEDHAATASGRPATRNPGAPREPGGDPRAPED